MITECVLFHDGKSLPEGAVVFVLGQLDASFNLKANGVFIFKVVVLKFVQILFIIVNFNHHEWIIKIYITITLNNDSTDGEPK